MDSSPLSRRDQRTGRRRRAASSLALLLGLGSGCIFELGELQEPVTLGGPGGSDGAGTGGSGLVGGGGDSGESLLGGAAGINGGPVCPAGQKACADGTCRSSTDPAFGCGDTACQQCPTPTRATVGCSESGQCVVVSCEPGFADCNGDTDAGLDLSSGDGCEHSFGNVQGFSDPVVAPFRALALDGQRDDWSGVPAQRLQAVCADCRDTATPPIVNEGTPPSSRDLDAYFRVAWDNDFLYVLSEAYDDQPFSSGADRVGQNGCRAAPECEDSLSVMLDGRQDGSYQRIFMGLAGDFSAPEQGQPSAGQVAFVATSNAGPRCLLVEARLDWEYVTRTQVGQAVSGKFPPAAGQTYGFDVAVSDVEPSSADAGDGQTQSRVFWLSPGPDYRFRSDGFGTLQLSGGPGQ